MNRISSEIIASSEDIEKLAAELKKSRSQEKILSAKLKNQLVRYEKLSHQVRNIQEQSKACEEASRLQIEALRSEHEQTNERHIRQKELLLAQYADLEDEYVKLSQDEPTSPTVKEPTPHTVDERVVKRMVEKNAELSRQLDAKDEAYSRLLRELDHSKQERRIASREFQDSKERLTATKHELTEFKEQLAKALLQNDALQSENGRLRSEGFEQRQKILSFHMSSPVS